MWVRVTAKVRAWSLGDDRSLYFFQVKYFVCVPGMVYVLARREFCGRRGRCKCL